MLPTADDGEATADEDRGVFDDLDGKSEANFYSNRGDSPEETSPASPEDEEDEMADLLADEMDDDYGDDDDVPATNMPIPPVNEDVLDVLRSEAAFSSARDKLGATTADALDGNTNTSEPEPDAINDIEEIEEAHEPVLDDLTAFLDAHSDDAPAEEEITEVEAEATTEQPQDDAPADSSFDPLSDLEAIRSQLNTIGEEQSADTEYTPNLPADDPVEDTLDVPEDADEDIEDDYVAEDDTPDATEDDEAEFDAAALTAALDGDTHELTALDDTDDSDFDDEDEGTRHAYRADGITPPSDTDGVENPEDNISDEADDDDDLAAALKMSASDGDDTPDEDGNAETEIEADTEAEVEAEVEADTTAAVSTAAAAIGMTRPRRSGTRTRARTIPGLEASTNTPPPSEDLTATIADAVKDTAQEISPDEIDDAMDTTPEVDPEPRTKRERKAVLPDVEELDASLRSEADEPRRRDREMMDAHEDEIANTGGGFRRAFIWTLFVIALLIALYVFRPPLVAAVPALAIVLDPYAAVIDTVRGLINNLFG
jgi:hypothetical protein